MVVSFFVFVFSLLIKYQQLVIWSLDDDNKNCTQQGMTVIDTPDMVGEQHD
jgi:hypothetical protein